MKLLCTPTTPDDAPRLSSMLQLYAYDFSEILPLDVGDDGRFHVPSVEASLTDPANHGFLIRVDERLAGFALVRPTSYLSGAAGVFDMAEMFVMRRYRRSGIGEQAAFSLFDRFRGPWEVREKSENLAAIAFWRRIISRYTDGRFEDLTLDEARWRGPVQRFDSRAP